MPPLTRPRTAAALAAFSLLLGLLVALPARAADVLLSQGKTATASSAENAVFGAAAAVDGDAGTRWSSAFGDPQWIQVDLGASAAISQVQLSWETAYASAFQIQVSADAANWTTVHSTTNGAGGNQTLTVSGTGRYVRVLGTQRATQWGYSLWEFKVFGSGSGPAPGSQLLSYNKPGVASSQQHDPNCWECTPARAFDLDAASRWATATDSGWVDPGWIYVDLGATAQIDKVVLQWDPASAKAYQLQVSNDAQNWSTIYTNTNGPGFKETLTVSGSGRYVRMYGTQRNTPYGYSLWEFQVYGTGGAPNTPPTPPSDPANPPQLIWQDEFNTPAGTKPDATKWRADPGTGQNNELQVYTNHDNVQTDGQGNLVIEARRQATPGTTCPVDPVSGSTTCQYTSGRINTGTKFDTTYGKIEARIKVPKGNGLWPAFWMMGSDFLTGRPWPYNGEIDIMEILGRETTKGYSTLHAPAYNGAGGYGGTYGLPGGADFSNDFHTWTMLWNSTSITYQVDGTTVFTVDKAQLEATRGPWIYDHPFYLILNVAVGGDFPGPPNNATPFPARMLVDYVRVYR
ncbi:family 16 glycosylhydrolase [Kribbella sandramycini]|uniref:Beta-glucanase (GH16 family) n=1 Tax=Kribbella sandramycini TaxID=60450 RepID=A0A7Y4KVB3_9ACTN|nr:discoidin domain-containing protein [Kribbella sandramycini]MBB6568123.1 beta-glucanase (GH16 family) [Kribbella sandramycini]NOL39283.1 family 16 glycosylhydrolase [Kribbella sandramycini]